ncbi:MAG: hypothetical protein ABWY17_08520 [Pseudomonas sp.]|uniref:hypothetical protein n=1 Tax=Pseudomonas sp. CFII64 TaxID=911242 RepID=UPI00035745B9|nr:hypothetical protein [Pseudomonas sp. CFII64]EPJ81975.1 hypothetical protein CFII64_17286 [Pseudomonas sp. CFII64]
MKVCQRLAASLLCVGCLSGGLAKAQETAPEPFILGIGTHLMNYPTPSRPALQLAADAGIASVKDDAHWSTAAPNANELRIVPSWRTYLTDAQSLGLSRLTILDYSTWFHDNAKPRSGEVKADFLRYVDYVTGQLGNRVTFYEIWNEWDIEAPKDPQLSADYAALVRDVVPLIRKNTQNVEGTPAKILAGSVTPEGMDYGFADRLIDAGMLDLVDGLSVHPYAHCLPNVKPNPEAWVVWMRAYEEHIRAKAGRDVPIYITEMAWPSHQGNCGFTPTVQAVYMARILFLARSLPNLKGMWWYDLVNDGPDRTDQEHNFGLLNEDLSPKPAYQVMKVIAPVIKDFSYDAQASRQSDNIYLLYFDKGPQRVVVGWTTGPTLQQDIASAAPMTGAVRLIDTAEPEKGSLSGEQWQCADQRCSVSVTLTHFPKIISLSPEETVATP